MPPAKKSLGQHFLASTAVAEAIVGALRPAPGDLIFEIGPGRGALTIPMARSGAAIVAYELDASLVELLLERCRGLPNVEIHHADIRTVNLDAVAAGRGCASYKVAGNIPYYLTSTILLDLARSQLCSEAVLMVQREVADRILARPGDRNCGILSIFLQSYFIIKPVRRVRPGSFTPPPKVEGMVLQLTPDSSTKGPEDRENFLVFLKGVFSHRRKKLRNILGELRGSRGNGGRSGTEAAELREKLGRLSGVDLDLRPEQLDREAWFRLFSAIRRAEVSP